MVSHKSSQSTQRSQIALSGEVALGGGGVGGLLGGAHPADEGRLGHHLRHPHRFAPDQDLEGREGRVGQDRRA